MTESGKRQFFVARRSRGSGSCAKWRWMTPGRRWRPAFQSANGGKRNRIAAQRNSVICDRWPRRTGPSRAVSRVSVSRSPPLPDPSGASWSEGRAWELTPVAPRPIQPARRDARPPVVARRRARRAAQRCRDPRSRCRSRPRGRGPVQETRMSPAPACPRIRAAMCTAIPPMSQSSSSHSPVWMPMRISMPSVSAPARNASAQRMACVGPSNVVRCPSPVPSPTCRPGTLGRRRVGGLPGVHHAIGPQLPRSSTSRPMLMAPMCKPTWPTWPTPTAGSAPAGPKPGA